MPLTRATFSGKYIYTDIYRQLKPGALGSIPGDCPDFFFSSSKLYDVARWGDAICGALVQFGCYLHRDLYVYACKVL